MCNNINSPVILHSPVIDTIKFTFSRAEFGEERVNILRKETEFFRRGVSKNGNHVEIRKLKSGFTCSVGRKNILFYGSLSHFYFGHNLSHVTQKEIGIALKRLSSEIGYPIWNARIGRIDIALTIEVPETPSTYIRCLSDSFEFIEYQRYGEHWIRYGKSNYHMIFYDKSKEMKSHKLVKGKNLLRCELQIKDRVSQQFHRDVRVCRLLTTSFLQQLEDQFQKCYFKTFRRSNFSSLPESLSSLEASYLQYGINLTSGVLELSGIVKKMKKGKLISPKQRTYFMNRIKSLYTTANSLQVRDLFSFVDEQIAVKHF